MTDENRAARRVSLDDLLNSGQLVEPLANLTKSFDSLRPSLDTTCLDALKEVLEHVSASLRVPARLLNGEVRGYRPDRFVHDEFYAFGKSLDLELNGPRAPTRRRRGRLAKKITRRGGYAKADGAVQAGLRALYKATAGTRTKYYVPLEPRGPGPQQIPYDRPDGITTGRYRS